MAVGDEVTLANGLSRERGATVNEVAARTVSTSGESRRPAPLPRSIRLLAMVLAVFPLGLLAVASQLEPSRGGLGTHQQLGLPPCSMRMLLGVRCPSCGMTTSWSHFTRGDWLASLASNTGGFLLAIYSLAFAVVSLWVGVSGRPPGELMKRWFAVSLLGIAVATLVDWGSRLLG